MSRDRYHEIGIEICRRYVDAFDPSTDPSACLSVEPGMIAQLEPDVMTCWGYADDPMMPPSKSEL